MEKYLNFKVLAIVLVAANIMLLAGPAQARNEVKEFSIQDVMQSEKAKSLLGSKVKFYFGSQKHRAISKRYGEFGSNKKTNAFNKSDQEACNHVFLSAMVSLRDRALNEGANAVVNIKSNYKRRESSSKTSYQCGAGNVIAGVALLGTMVKLK